MRTLMQKTMTGLHRLVNTVSGGRFGNRMMGAPVLFLTTVGRKSGKERVTPLLFLDDGDAKVIVASNGGDPHHPSWFHNLQANPDVRVKVNGREYAARAEIVSEG